MLSNMMLRTPWRSGSGADNVKVLVFSFDGQHKGSAHITDSHRGAVAVLHRGTTRKQSGSGAAAHVPRCLDAMVTYLRGLYI